jgi:hypothetical protein
VIPDDRAWRHHERIAAANRDKPLPIPFLTAHSLRNLATRVERVQPRSGWIAEAIRALADDVETHG